VVQPDDGEGEGHHRGEPGADAPEDQGAAPGAALAEADLELVQQRPRRRRIGLEREGLVHPGERPGKPARRGLLRTPSQQGRD
jgi:hypothetical protein